MMSAIVLEAHTRIDPEHQGVRRVEETSFTNIRYEWAAEGIQITHNDDYDAVNLVAEFAPVRPYSRHDLRKGIVANIGGQRYMLRVEIFHDEDYMDTMVSTGATITFVPTDAPETPWEPWDEAAEVAKRVRDLEGYLADLDCDEDDVRYYRNQIADLESGKTKLLPGGYALLFGKPQWIQWPIFPAFEGKAARCLMVLETGWGDSGNINLLFTQDADGRPNHVWFEASCC